MKSKLILMPLCLTVFLTGCKKDDFELPPGLVQAKSNLTADLSALDQKMASAVLYIGSINADTSLIRAKMADLAEMSPEITDFGWVTPDGILQLIEPSLYHGSQGVNISTQDHIIKSFNTRQPVLSKVFMSVEGFSSVVLIHPQVTNSVLYGGLSALFYPENLLENILKPIFEGQDFELWVMEKGGRIIYDQDDFEIGLDLFTDPLYAGFPELITAGHKIDNEESGTTTYSFYKAGTQETVTKLTYWTTYSLHGTEWKIVWVKPQP
ncbi:MAG TPA: hypothetical protein DC042_05460 [Bacteroidales bacterium]|nr:hypothetical protein [Bacteroidales bacterium]